MTQAADNSYSVSVGRNIESVKRFHNPHPNNKPPCGSNKTAAVLGALRTGLLDSLIIDDRTLSEVEKADAE